MAPLVGNLSDVNSVNHGDANVQCTPATPWSIFLFFASNYLAHCATVKMYPGSPASLTIFATGLALFFPSSGIIRALFSIKRHARFRRNRNPLERAAAAGALRMVVRNEDWEPREGDQVRPLLNKRGEMLLADGTPLPKLAADGPGEEAPVAGSPQRLSPGTPAISGILAEEDDPVSEESDDAKPFSFASFTESTIQKFHGLSLLPPGYSWRDVPPDAKISWEQPAREEPGSQTGGAPDVSSNYNWIQSLIAIFQAGSAALTLYRSRGDQIQRYGYAAFGLTVVPYLVMSIVNLMASIATADYPTVYMVGSAEMDEARRRGGVFDGVVGRLESDIETSNADAPLYELKYKHLDPATPKEFVKVLERVSGSGAYPPSINISSSSYANEAGMLSVAAYTPLAPHSRPLPRTRSILSNRLVQEFIIPTLLSSLSLVVVGALTRFNAGASTVAQRGLTMSWLIIGIVFGWWADMNAGLFFIVSLGFLIVPAVGGFIVVAEMLREYGICDSA
ncbi:uncharacterized protein THITE_2145780 [Thermothielavioides terrestris NRRL 8126]|uniref:Uncharacterized protein n=1 Tax=Thermothielavioides terrestris (strain ATCC 38088 / NRRL 8126) TaxID=578455 RepID=G2R9G0_THETT|nr:uncharacterized protein THITE_2145780 [Thermothielavioides terrestris NRRL 8126]AEO68701.1 hypothetical protein THITE_2145780 [Thermothielavioides terrestris NRRL 8126]